MVNTQLSGSIPPQIGNLTNLLSLQLATNQLTGAIPPSLGNLTKLKLLDLSQNELTGSIPASLGSLTEVEQLSLSSNDLAGSIPAALGNLPKLWSLDLHKNQLTGSIPPELGNLPSLVQLFLQDNHLTGSVPSQFGNLRQLYGIWLQGNQLTGALPSSLILLTSLQNCDLRWNGLYSSDTAVVEFVNGMNQGPHWQNTQTVPVTNVAVAATTESTVSLTWEPIAYTSDPGCYQIFLSSGSDPETLAGATPDKNSTGFTVRSLKPATTYYFIVRSVTYAHANNQNTVLSDPTPVVRATTLLTPSPLTITSTSPLPGGTVGVAYSVQFAASGGTGAYTWSFVTGSVPGGLSLTSGGLLSGMPTTSGDFTLTVRVTDSASTTAQGTFALHVTGCTAPLITLQPRSAIISSGETATLSVIATGTAPLAYQWYLGLSGDTSNPVGANATTLTTPALTTTTSYWVRISNTCGYTDSATATLTTGAAVSSVWVPVASHTPGLRNSQWRSDLGLLNVGAVTANVEIAFYGSDGVVTNTTYVPPGVQSILSDVVGQLGGSGSGALEIFSDQPIMVMSRTYNQVSSTASCYPNGTQGADYPALTATDGLSASQAGYLTGLTENSAYRCNIGVVNTGSASAVVLVELFNGSGTRLAGYPVPLTAGQWAQETQPFLNKAGQTAMDRGYAKITVQTGSGVFAFASVIDNITNDPTTLKMLR